VEDAVIPGSFDPVTAREYLGDSLSRHIEAKARTDADGGVFDRPDLMTSTYADRVYLNMMIVVYAEQYRKRRARLERMK
jgi:hypothetical protein